MSRIVKNILYDQFSRTTKSLSSPKRLEIIDLLSQGEKNVETIAEQADLGVKNASAQLKELKSAHLVDSRKDGKYVIYYIADPEVIKLWREVRSFGEKRFN
jgi:DNA-binding transcriptional ArsR family regulator